MSPRLISLMINDDDVDDDDDDDDDQLAVGTFFEFD